MIRTAIVLALGVLASSSVDAYEQYKAALPSASTLARAPQTNEMDMYVYFRGHMTLQVTYRFVYDEESGYSDNPYLLLMPDEKGLAQMPYLTERGKPERPAEIFVLNPKEAAGRLLSKELAAEIQAGKHKEISGTAVVSVDGIGVGYECDRATSVARFVSLKQVVTKPVATPPGRRHGC